MTSLRLLLDMRYLLCPVVQLHPTVRAIFLVGINATQGQRKKLQTGDTTRKAAKVT